MAFALYVASHTAIEANTKIQVTGAFMQKLRDDQNKFVCLVQHWVGDHAANAVEEWFLGHALLISELTEKDRASVMKVAKDIGFHFRPFAV